ncbi:hypothetical protein [Paenibacillus larvae]|uniref:hypothetical protein n=1 Tax=Paenibacillus larvae TaxID=1464 RepID=UPI0022814ECE|nr:hypothetical protein [Paenibacillus larvae]MCY9771707.1 hypothetical protein [Paenibacillus larvae]
MRDSNASARTASLFTRLSMIGGQAYRITTRTRIRLIRRGIRNAGNGVEEKRQRTHHD